MKKKMVPVQQQQQQQQQRQQQRHHATSFPGRLGTRLRHHALTSQVINRETNYIRTVAS